MGGGSWGQYRVVERGCRGGLCPVMTRRPVLGHRQVRPHFVGARARGPRRQAAGSRQGAAGGPGRPRGPAERSVRARG